MGIVRSCAGRLRHVYGTSISKSGRVGKLNILVIGVAVTQALILLNMGTRGSRKPISYKAVDVIRAYCKDTLLHRKQTRVFPNTFIGSWEGDIFEVSPSGYLTEIELKLTRSDFFGDKDKARRKRDYLYKHGDPRAYKTQKKYDFLERGERVNRFFYLIPEGMVTEAEVPDWAGLITFKPYDAWGRVEFGFRTIKNAKRLSDIKYGEKHLLKLLESTYYRYHFDRIAGKTGVLPKESCQ